MVFHRTLSATSVYFDEINSIKYLNFYGMGIQCLQDLNSVKNFFLQKSNDPILYLVNSYFFFLPKHRSVVL